MALAKTTRAPYRGAFLAGARLARQCEPTDGQKAADWPSRRGPSLRRMTPRTSSQTPPPPSDASADSRRVPVPWSALTAELGFWAAARLRRLATSDLPDEAPDRDRGCSTCEERSMILRSRQPVP
jgi:hypothetical protein